LPPRPANRQNGSSSASPLPALLLCSLALIFLGGQAAVLETVGLIAGLHDMAKMRQAIEQRRRHLGVAEHGRPSKLQLLLESAASISFAAWFTGWIHRRGWQTQRYGCLWGIMPTNSTPTKWHHPRRPRHAPDPTVYGGNWTKFKLWRQLFPSLSCASGDSPSRAGKLSRANHAIVGHRWREQNQANRQKSRNARSDVQVARRVQQVPQNCKQV